MSDDLLSFSIAPLDMGAQAWSPDAIQAQQVAGTLDAWAAAVGRYGTGENMGDIHALLRGRLLQHADTGAKATAQETADTIGTLFARPGTHADTVLAALMLVDGPDSMHLGDVYAITNALHAALPHARIAWTLGALDDDGCVRARIVTARDPRSETGHAGRTTRDTPHLGFRHLWAALRAFVTDRA